MYECKYTRIVTSHDLKLSKLSACGPDHVVLLFQSEVEFILCAE